MKIKLAIYSKDMQYVEHLVNYFNIYFNETVELNVFDKEKLVSEYLKNYRIDIVLLDDGESLALNSGTIPAYLTEENSTNDDRNCIFKYQKGELIYKNILNIYANGTNRIFTDRKTADETHDTIIHLFLPINGGAGASTVSKAYAIRLAKEKRVLYLGFEMFGNCERILKGEGNFSLDDILYTLKSRRGNLLLKLESALKKNADKVGFYAPLTNPINFMDITGEEFHLLLTEMRKSGLFDEIIVDMDIFPSVWMIESLKEAKNIWLVADGTEASNEKYDKFKEFIEALERKEEQRFLPKMKIFYNKYRSRSGKMIGNCTSEIAGGSPFYEGMEGEMIVKEMSTSEAFTKSFFKEEQR